jgi:cytochrome c biogenesis protein CcdA/thiol-disulfide isomerase/thioredoxin
MDKTITTAGLALAVILVVILSLLVIPGMIASPAPAVLPQGSGTVTVYFFYGEECPHCHDVMPLVIALRQKYPDVDVRILEIWHNPANFRVYSSLHSSLGIPEGGVPEVIVGNVVLSGSRDIPDKLEQTILDQKKTLLREIPPTAVLGSGPEIVPSSPVVNAVYFYGDTCSYCDRVKPLLAEMEKKYPGLSLTRLEVYNDAGNREQLASLARPHGIENPGVPVVFIGNHVLYGYLEITNRFENEILIENERLASGGAPAPLPVVTADPKTSPPTTVLTLPLVIGAALVDSANPCGLSVLVFLLLTMTAAANRKRILLVGGAYITAMFLFHLLVGIGLFSVFSLSGLSRLFSLIGGAIALLLGIITLADVLRNKETFFLSIPESRKGLVGDYARRASLPAAFVLGILAGVLGFSCTGGIYISILGLMGRDMTILTGLPWLVLYNLVYILPLVLITLLVAYGISPERADRLRAGSRRTLRAIIGLILVGLGAVILLGWIG